MTYDLAQTYGPENAAKLASAYRTALVSISRGDWECLPNRSARLSLVEAMLREGRRNGFDPARLSEVALASVVSGSQASQPWYLTLAGRRGLHSAFRYFDLSRVLSSPRVRDRTHSSAPA
jgi:hypothetical protein